MKLKFLDDGLSIDETNKSTLIIAFLVALSLSVYCVIVQGDVPTNLLALNKALIYTIGAVNGVNLATQGLNTNTLKGGK